MNGNTILLAEDDANDVAFLKDLLEECCITNPMQVVADGEQLLCYLKGEGIYADRTQYPLPMLLLLDLKMPRKDGLQALTWIHAEFRPQFPVIVLTGSKDIQAMNKAYMLGARSFLAKPLQKEEFRTAVCSLKGIQVESDDESHAWEHFTPPISG
jgi:CheY-like chemotaxis protein